MEDISYRFATADDALQLSVLMQVVYISAYAEDGVTPVYAHFVTERFSPEYIKGRLAEYPDSFIIATYKGNPVGVAELLFGKTCPIANVEGVELTKLYVLGQFSSKGVGAKLLAEFEKVATTRGYTHCWLEVWDLNPRGITFYLRNGYEELGQVPFVMDDATYTNRVMLKTLN